MVCLKTIYSVKLNSEKNIGIQVVLFECLFKKQVLYMGFFFQIKLLMKRVVGPFRNGHIKLAYKKCSI